MLRVLQHAATAAIALTVVGYSAPAYAQATRTWVSGVGDDANPCSRTAPCKTFAGAISKTAAGGEINCIDQGAYGAVTITKSIAIICEGVTAGVLHSSTNGIVINAAATDDVFLKGLDINGSPPTSPGLNGIRFLAGNSLTVENLVIRGSTGASPNGYGILFAPSGTASLVVRNSTIANNGSGTTGGGILVQPTGGGRARAQIERTQIIDNGGSAIRADTTGNTGLGNYLTITDSVLSGNVVGINVLTPAATSSVVMAVVGSTITHNSVNGILANGATNQIRVTGTTITNNGSGAAGQGGVVAVSGAGIVTYGDNLLFGNTPDGAFTFGPTGKN